MWGSPQNVPAEFGSHAIMFYQEGYGHARGMDMGYGHARNLFFSFKTNKTSLTIFDMFCHLPTVTVNIHVSLLPALSVAVHVTGVAPTWNSLPEDGIHEISMAVSMSSVAVGSGQETCVVDAILLAGQVITGFV